MIIQLYGGPKDGDEVDVPTPPFHHLRLPMPESESALLYATDLDRGMYPTSCLRVILYRLERQINVQAQWRYVYVYEGQE